MLRAELQHKAANVQHKAPTQSGPAIAGPLPPPPPTPSRLLTAWGGGGGGAPLLATARTPPTPRSDRCFHHHCPPPWIRPPSQPRSNPPYTRGAMPRELAVQVITSLPLAYICFATYFALFRVNAFNYNKLLPRCDLSPHSPGEWAQGLPVRARACQATRATALSPRPPLAWVGRAPSPLPRSACPAGPPRARR